MDENMAYIRRLIQSGHFNHTCSTEVDTEMAERAMEIAIAADAEQREDVMDDLTAFISARLDDDERYARVFLALGQRLKDNPSPAVTAIGQAGIDMMLDASEAVAEAMRWKCRAPNDLERVLREVAAKRARLALYVAACDAARKHGGDPYMVGIAAGLEVAVKRDAAVWSDHPDYQQEWTM